MNLPALLLSKSSLPLFRMAAMVVITMPTTIIAKTSRISQFAFQLNFMFKYLISTGLLVRLVVL